MNATQTIRLNRLMPNGIPRYVRCYDNGGETLDRYTIVFTGYYSGKKSRVCEYVGSSEFPSSPMGFYQHGEGHDGAIDRPTYSHLGKKITFESLPDTVKPHIIHDYKSIWNL